MTKTQFNFALPTDLLSFTSSKIDNSASTDPLMPADKSPDFYYEGTKADASLQQVSLYYDITDGYKKKLLVDGVTTDLDAAGADDAVTNISLEGATNPLTFLFRTTDTAVGYIWNPTDSKMIALQSTGGGTTNSIIADATTFETIYDDLTALPAPVDLTILFKTPNPLTGTDEPVKSFNLEVDMVGGYMTYTFVRDDSSTFTMTVEEAASPITEQGITFTKQLTIIDGAITNSLTYYSTDNISMGLVQLSGYIYDAATGMYTTTKAQDIDNAGVYNPLFDGFRVILITSLTEINIGGETIVTNPSDSGYIVTSDAARRVAIAKHFKRLKQISHKANARFVNPLKNIGKTMKKIK